MASSTGCSSAGAASGSCTRIPCTLGSAPNCFTRRTTASVLVRIPFDVPFARVKALCLATVDEVTHAVKSRGRWANLKELADGHQIIGAGFWVSDMDHVGEAVSEFNEKLLASMRQENLSLHITTAPLAPR